MEVINSDKAPAAIGTYNQAIRVDNTVYLSGQIPLVAETMKLCSDKIEEQIQQVFDNLQAVCKACGGDLKNVVKLTIYLTNLHHFPLVNELMAKNFDEPYPARAAIGVSQLPKGAQVEMDGILVLNSF
jgi:reactive intermediate/imine deaminase